MSAIYDVTSTQIASTYSSSYTSTTKKTDDETENTTTATEEAAVYEKSSTESSATYSINKMSEEDRASLVQQLQEEQAAREQSFLNTVYETVFGQSKSYSIATGDDSIWKFLASGDYTVTEAAKVQAQEDISEDGYWGVTQTSQRLFDFASALAGDDVDKMKEMQEAMMEGFSQATEAWGGELPSISQQTIDAANQLFEEYYASKGVTE